MFPERSWGITSRKKRTSEHHSDGTLQQHSLPQVQWLANKQHTYQSIMYKASCILPYRFHNNVALPTNRKFASRGKRTSEHHCDGTLVFHKSKLANKQHTHQSIDFWMKWTLRKVSSFHGIRYSIHCDALGTCVFLDGCHDNACIGRIVFWESLKTMKAGSNASLQ